MIPENRRRARATAPFGVALLLALAAASVLSTTPAARQRPTGTARDVSAPPTGTGTIGGRVVSDEPGHPPVRRAVVQLSSSAAPAAGRTTVTDDDGRFAVTGLPAGRFTMLVVKPGWPTTYYGATTPWRAPGAPIALDEGQQVTDLAVTLTRGGVIAGRLTDADGQPVTGARVTALTPRTVNGQVIYSQAIGATMLLQQTDDEGAYRLYGLPPGEYILQASVPQTPARRISPDEVAWALGRGGAPGATSQAAPPPPPGPTVVYAPAYYPGTTTVAAAARLRLDAGQALQGIDFALQFVPTSRVSGTVTRSDGVPVRGAQITLTEDGPQVGALVFSTTGRSVVQPDGSFQFPSVLPGRYIVNVRAASQAPAPPARGTRPQAPTLDLWASADVSVNGADITDLTLTLQPGMTISGRVVLEATTLEAPADLSRVRLQLRPPDMMAITNRISLQTAPANADGTFTLSGVVPDQYVLFASLPGGNPSEGTGWMLKSIRQGGRTWMDEPIEMRGGQDLTGVEITLTDRAAQISGRLLDAADRPAPEFFVFAFPVDRSAWRLGSMRLRQPVRPDTNGGFRVSMLPPGEYYVAALASFEETDWFDPTFLEQVAAASIRLTLAEGEQKVQDIRIAR
ncbi:MAG: carboxypeptidase-like regulatory domain-containing protein [Vicinamibacterales bacterium]